MPIELVTADESDLMRLGIRTLIARQQDYVIAAEASSVKDLLHVTAHLQPQVVLYGDSFFDSDSLWISEQLAVAAPRTKRMVIGTLAEGAVIHELFAIGITAYLYRADPLEETLLLALHTVLRDRLYLSPTANAEYLLALHSAESLQALDDEARAVLRLLIAGWSAGQIARHLRCSLRHVYWVRHKLRKRFGATTNEHLIRRALDEGFGASE